MVAYSIAAEVSALLAGAWVGWLRNRSFMRIMWEPAGEKSTWVGDLELPSRWIALGIRRELPAVAVQFVPVPGRGGNEVL